MKPSALCLALVAVVVAAASHAADPTVKDKVQVAWHADNLPLHIAMESTLEIKAPAVPARPGQIAVLRLQARLDCAANSGWNKFLPLTINGQPVYQTLRSTRNGPHRVLNRDTEWAPPGMEADYVLFQENRLCVVFAPDFKQFDQRLAPEGEETFWYVLNVSDLLKPDGENVIRLGNTGRAVWFNNENRDMVIGDLSLGYLPTPPAGAGSSAFRPLPKGQTASGAGFTLTLTPQGGMAVQVGKEHYLLETSLTWPNGDLNWLDCPGRPGPAEAQEWKVTRAALSAQGGSVVAEGRFYRLTREIKLDGPRVRVADTIENRTDADLGIALSYDLTAGGPLPELYLGGDDDPSLTYSDVCGANPTVFAAQQASGLGWLAEDDLLRAQLRMQTGRGVTSMKTINLGLAPKTSATLRWTLYPTASGDYWDFINRVRRDWDVNFAIEGPFSFIGHCKGISEWTTEKLTQRFTGRRVVLATMHPWTAYQYPYDREQHKAWWLKAQPMVHEALPGSKCLLMMEPPLEARVHETKIEEDPYRDAMVLNPDGKVAFDLEYGPSYVGQDDFAQGWRLVWRYPTLTNTWGKYLEYDVKFAMDECRADGMYIDCFSYGFSRSWARYTYDRWDGHTVDLDPKTHVITRKYADLSLLSSAACERIIRLIQEQGGVVVANSEPVTENLRKVRINRFVETGGGAQSSCGTHLYTPIALGYPWYQLSADRQRDMKRFMADVIVNLKYGALYYYYGISDGLTYGFVNRMFPFTPRELHSGWLVGEERIITTKSGEYGWGDKSGAKVYHYDNVGTETLVDLPPRVVNGAHRFPVQVGEGEIAILERAK